MLAPIESHRVSEDAVAQMVKLIQTRELCPGDRLPAERKLVESLRVGRTSVREALRSLEGMGLIVVRAGIVNWRSKQCETICEWGQTFNAFQ